MELKQYDTNETLRLRESDGSIGMMSEVIKQANLAREFLIVAKRAYSPANISEFFELMSQHSLAEETPAWEKAWESRGLCLSEKHFHPDAIVTHKNTWRQSWEACEKSKEQK